MLSRDEILAASDLQSEVVAVPEWGGEVRVRVLTGAERIQLIGQITATGASAITVDYQALLLQLCLVDDAGAQLFKPEDIPKLSGKNSLVMAKLFGIAQRLNRLQPGAVDDAVKL